MKSAGQLKIISELITSAQYVYGGIKLSKKIIKTIKRELSSQFLQVVNDVWPCGDPEKNHDPDASLQNIVVI